MMTPEQIADLPSSKLGLRQPIEDLRQDILNTSKAVMDFKDKMATEQPVVNEAIANAMLAYRHLEDARMRLGKVLQAIDGGVSIYDK